VSCEGMPFSSDKKCPQPRLLRTFKLGYATLTIRPKQHPAQRNGKNVRPTVFLVLRLATRVGYPLKIRHRRHIHEASPQKTPHKTCQKTGRDSAIIPAPAASSIVEGVRAL
jgi:hypothetical protein